MSIILIVLLLTIIAMGFWLPGFLSLHNPVDTNNVLIEAWISHLEIEQAVHQFKSIPDALFFVVGRTYPADSTLITLPEARPGRDGTKKDGTWLYANSSLGFAIPPELTGDLPDSIPIRVEVMGQEAGGQRAFFNLAVNGHCVGGGFAEEQLTVNDFYWIPGDHTLKTMYVRFMNDLKTPYSDRNLLVASITVNGVQLPADEAHSRITREMTIQTTGFTSQAEETAAYLRALGVPARQVVVIEFEPPKRNLTRQAAIKFGEYMARREPFSLNVVSYGIHCRRTWITYKKMSNSKAEVGILNYHPEGYDSTNEYSDQPFIFHLAEESLTYLVNWLQLTFK